MFNSVRADFVRYCQVDGAGTDISFLKKLRVWFSGYGLQVLTAQRFYRWSLQGKSGLVKAIKFPLMCISFILYKIVENLYDIRISRHAQIEPGCYIGHFGGIRIGRCYMGRLCNINHQVKIGACVQGEYTKQTVLGDRVWVGAHSTIKEGVRIGNGVVISAGSIVTSDIQDRVLVAGPSARVLRRSYDNDNLLGISRKDK